MNGSEAWQKGFMRKENPWPMMSVERAQWDNDFMDEMEKHYAEDLSATESATGANNLDEKASIPGEPPGVCRPVMG